MAHGPPPPYFQALASRRSFLIQAGLLGLGGATLWLLRERLVFPQPTIATAGGEPDSGWLPFASRDQPVVTVEARIGGVEVRALIDSGAQHSVLDRAFAERLDPSGGVSAPVVAYGVGGQPQMGRTAAVDVDLGALSLRGLRAVVLELGPISALASLGAPLVIGQDVLSALIADIDFPERRILFSRPDAHDLPGGAEKAPVRAQGRALAAQVTVEDAALEVIVDTGASAALSLASDVARAAGLLDGRPEHPGQAIVLGGVAPGRIVRAERFEFAGRVREDVPVHIFEPQRLPGFPKGLLGYDALRRYRAIFNHRAGTLHLVSPDPARPSGAVRVTLGS